MPVDSNTVFWFALYGFISRVVQDLLSIRQRLGEANVCNLRKGKSSRVHSSMTQGLDWLWGSIWPAVLASELRHSGGIKGRDKASSSERHLGDA